MFHPLHLLFRGGGGAQHCTQMKKQCESLKRLTPKEFDAALLEKLTQQGRVYVDMPRANNDAYKREVLDYVQSIADFVTADWREDLDGLWHSIVESPLFRNCLVMKRGLDVGHMNRYAVTNLVCRMKNKGVYRDEVSMLSLHLILENTSERNRYYESSGNYALSSEAKSLLKELLRRV